MLRVMVGVCLKRVREQQDFRLTKELACQM